MAEPLKDRFGPEVVTDIAASVASVAPSFDREAFLARGLEGYDGLELTARARHVGDTLAEFLPADRDRALRTVLDAVRATDGTEAPSALAGFRYLPYVYFVAEHGLDHFETAMAVQYELTKRFTAEFSIRPYLTEYPERTLARLALWADDPDVDVRRLVSEGTRPRLPWAPRLPAFQADPGPVLDLLETLKDDPEEYVRRSVANNLNDIAKDHPDLAVQTARDWWADGDENRRRLVRHGLRTLVKRGDPQALAVLGYEADSPARPEAVSFTPEVVAIGDKVRIEAEIVNPTDVPVAVLVDLRVHFVKARGSTGPRVFKGAEHRLEPHGSATVRKTVSLAQLSTRTHHPGRHRVEVLVNGRPHDVGHFEVT